MTARCDLGERYYWLTVMDDDVIRNVVVMPDEVNRTLLNASCVVV